MTNRQREILYGIRADLYTSANGHEPSLTWEEVYDMIRKLDEVLDETKEEA